MNSNIIKFGTLALAGLGLVWLSLKSGKVIAEKRAVRNKILEGEYARVEYSTAHDDMFGLNFFMGRQMPMTQTVKDITVVHMCDGSSVSLMGRRDMTFPVGAKIVIEENGLGERFIVRQV